jgi:hypothetical protein
MTILLNGDASVSNCVRGIRCWLGLPAMLPDRQAPWPPDGRPHDRLGTPGQVAIGTPSRPGPVVSRGIRHFARYLKQFEPETEVPEELAFGPEPGRVAPHIFHDHEIVELLAAARQLGPSGQHPPSHLRNLVWPDGLDRPARLRGIHLRDADVDLNAWDADDPADQSSPSHELPIHPSTVAALACYRKATSTACGRRVPTCRS